MAGFLKLQLNPKNSISLATGTKGSSGYDISRDKTAPDGYDRSSWTVIGGKKFKVSSGKLYDAASGDYIAVAYNRHDDSVLAFWNKTKKEGSRSNIFQLLFHPVWIIMAGILALVIYFMGQEAEIGEQERQLTYAGCGLLMLLTVIYCILDWRAHRVAQALVDKSK